MKLAIVILNWNGRAMLESYLPGVIEHSANEATIYVADNASTDESLDFIEKRCPECRIIRFDKNWGFAEGYNKALKQIDATYYLLLNSDVEVRHDWLSPLLDFMDGHPQAAACQPKILSATHHNMFEYAGAAGGFIDRYGYPYCRGRLFNTIEKDNGQYDFSCPVMWATGACMMIRSADYWAAGGLDARFFAHNEEIDLCWRLRLMGREIYCVAESAVFHVGGGTLPQGNPMKTFFNFRNNLTMLYKNLPEKELRRVMSVRRLLDYTAALKMLLIEHNVGEFKAVVRGRRAFRRWLPQFRDDRKRIQQSAVNTNIPERTANSIVWEYYGRGHKLYSQL